MRTYVLVMAVRKTKQKSFFRCEAKSFSEAIAKAEQASPGFFGALSPSLSRGQVNASVNR